MNKLLMMVCALVMFQLTRVGATSATLLEQRTQTFGIVLNGTVAETTPLLGPLREAEWAPDWSPHFLHPVDGAQREGAVFVTNSHGRERIWVLTKYDVENGRVNYVVVTPGFTTNEIAIRVVADGKHRSKATISYRCSALTPEGNKDVAKLDAHWAEEQHVHWEKAINEALAKGDIHD
jgi:hypothetical protein